MASLTQVDFDPFASSPQGEVKLTPVDHDPFAQGGARMTPVDYDPFSQESTLSYLGRRFSEGNKGVSRAHAGAELAAVENYDVQGAARDFARPRLPGDAEPASSAFLDEQAGNLMRFKEGKYLLGADMSPAQARESAARDAFTDAQARRGKDLLDQISANSPDSNMPQRDGVVGFAGDVAANLPRLGRTMGVGVATGGFGAVPYMAEQIFGESYANYRQKGKDPKRAAIAAGINALAQAPLEYIPSKKLLDLLGGKGSKLAGLAKVMGAEGFTEYLQAYPEAFADIYVENPGASPMEMAKLFAAKIATGDFHKQAAYEGAVGAVTGGGIAGVGAALAPKQKQSEQTSAPADSLQTKADLADRIAQAESGGDINAKNPNSSARGIYQFTQATRDGILARHGVDAYSEDPAEQRKAYEALTAENNAALASRLGRAPTDGETYMAHFLGASGGADFLEAMAATPEDAAINHVSPGAASANRSIFYDGDRPRTLSEVYSLMSGKVGQGASGLAVAKEGGQGVAMSAPDVQAQPGAESEQLRPELAALREDIQARNPEVSASADWRIVSVQEAADEAAGVPRDMARENELRSLRADIQAREVQQRVLEEQGVTLPAREAERMRGVAALPPGQGFEMVGQPFDPKVQAEEAAQLFLSDELRTAKQAQGDPITSFIWGRIDSRSVDPKTGLALKAKFGPGIFAPRGKGAALDVLTEELNSTGRPVPGGFGGDPLASYLLDRGVSTKQAREQYAGEVRQAASRMASSYGGDDMRRVQFRPEERNYEVDDVPFSGRGGYGPGLSRDQAQLAVSALQSQTEGAAPMTVITRAEIPAAILSSAERQGHRDAANRIEGWRGKDGRVYLVAENLESPQRAVEVWLHEQVAHHGLRGMLGGDLQTVLRAVQRDHKAASLSEAEEIVARIAEKLDAGQTLSAREGFTWRKVVDAVRAWLAKRGLSVSRANLEALLRQSLRTMARGEGRSGQMQEAEAYSVQDNPRKTLAEALRSQDFKDIDFGRLSPKKLRQVNYLMDKFSAPLLKDDRLVIPANVVRKLHGKRIVKDGMTADEVADMLWSIFHSDKTKVIPSKHAHIQTLVNAREELSRIGFISEGMGGRAVVKSGHMVKTGRLEETALGGRAFPPSSAQDNPDVPRQAARFSDVQGGSSQKEITPPVSDDKGEVNFSFKPSPFQAQHMAGRKEATAKPDVGRVKLLLQRLFTDKTAPARALAQQSGGKSAAEAFDAQARRRSGTHGIVADMIEENGGGVSRYGDAGSESEVIPGSKTLGAILAPFKRSFQMVRDFESFMVASRMLALEDRNAKDAGRIQKINAELLGIAKDIRSETDPVRRGQLEKLSRSLKEERFNLQSRHVKELDAAGASQELDRLRQQYGQGGMDLFRSVHKEFVTFADQAVLQPLRDAGILSHERYQAITKGPEHDFYVSFQREMDDLEGKGALGSPGGPKRIKGSSRKIVSPVASMIAAVQRAVSQVETAKTNEALVSLRDVDPSMAEVIKKSGQGPFPANRSTTITTWRNGVATHWTVPREVALGLNEAGPETMRVFRMATAPLRWASQVFRLGTTVLSPVFSIRNAIRDNVSAATMSKYGYFPPRDFLRGLVEYIKDASGKGSDVVSEWRRAGGETGVYTAMERSMVELTAEDLLGIRERTTTGMLVQWAGTPFKAIRYLNEAMEQATRLGLYKNARDKGASVSEAMLEGRDTTVDFSRSGLAGQFINQIIPFWNANVQGVEKMVRSMGRPRFWLNVALGVTAPSILEWLAFHDDEEWRQLADWERDLFWHIRLPWMDRFIRIPKPFDIGGIYGSAVQRMLDQLAGHDPEGMGKAAKVIVQSLTPPFSNPLVTPFVENARNRSFFTGRPIESQSMQNLPPWMRFHTGTTEIAKAVGRLIDVSPVKVDNWIRSQFGTVGMDIAKTADGLVSGKAPAPERKWYEKTPLVSSLVSREPIGSSSQSVNAFYDNLERTTQAAAGAKAANPEDAGRFDQKDVFYAPAFRKVSGRMSDMRQEIAAIQQDMDMDPADKRRRIDSIQREMTRMAGELNAAYRADRPTPEALYLGAKTKLTAFDEARRSGDREEAARLMREHGRSFGLLRSTGQALSKVQAMRGKIERNTKLSPEQAERFREQLNAREAKILEAFESRYGGRR